MISVTAPLTGSDRLNANVDVSADVWVDRAL